MKSPAYRELARAFPRLHLAVLGDFCLDRYWEIDPRLQETSIETGLPVHNVTRVRGQPGGAGTVVNNLAALGVGRIEAIGFCGDDGEGFELRRALANVPGVDLSNFVATPERATFTYGKPLVMESGPPRELSRLDIKNWTPTPAAVEDVLIAALDALCPRLDALIVLDQIDGQHLALGSQAAQGESRPNTGVVTSRVLEAVGRWAAARPELLILADSRRGLRGFPPLGYKMNARELAAMQGVDRELTQEEIERASQQIAASTSRPVFVTLSERGIVGALPNGEVRHVPTWPVRGPIDIVGAGDAVMANLTAALAAGAALEDALSVSMAAASIVIHQLGTTGTATVEQIAELLSR